MSFGGFIRRVTRDLIGASEGYFEKDIERQKSNARVIREMQSFTLAEKLGFASDATFEKLAQIEQIKFEERERRKRKYHARK